MSGKLLRNQKANFGTLPVFVTSISTILGAILFLRFGYAVSHVGFLGVVGIILLGHMVTVPAALAVAEIATNQKVQGGGAYFIISRSFGLNIGAAIGIALYLSQAISVAFYVIAFAEAFNPLIDWFGSQWGIQINDLRFISLPAMILLSVIMLTRGANVGMKFLYGVVSLLFAALILFFLGKGGDPPERVDLVSRISRPDNFFYVFTIVFPAFTGLAAGLGLSGDLKDPSRSIPRGTIAATIAGFVVYLFVAYKLVISVPLDEMAADQLIMQRIALWGPIIPIGLAAASLSSSLGSVIVAPRTLQAIAADKVFPSARMNSWLKFGRQGSNEPVNASVISLIIAFFFVIVGDIDFVARIISMFFMVTYGAICLISFLEHFAADPAYRPTFRSRWYFSLIGALMSFWLMFKMNTPYAILSLFIMGLFYYMISESGERQKGLVKLFRGVVFQLSRQLQVFAQRADKEDLNRHWRPFAICISEDSFKRRSAFDLLRWISYKYGFGTYIHYIKGLLNSKTNQQSREDLEKLLNLASGSRNRVYLDTIISPSYTSAIAQVIQLSGISGKGNNLILFEFSRSNPQSLDEPLKNFELIRSTGFDVCVMNTSYKGFGYRREIHVWIGPQDYGNANLMILLSYIILGHPEWSRAVIKIFALFFENELDIRRERLEELIRSGRLPISPANLELVARPLDRSNKEVVEKHSADAGLIIMGYDAEDLRRRGSEVFLGYEDACNILFVNSNKQKDIT